MEPLGRYEWERIVRRIVMPKPHKLLALVLATYSDPDGTRVRPGNEILANVTGDSEKNVRRIMSVLRDMGLISLVSRGGGRSGKGKVNEYRLTIPVDLLERFTLLLPGDRADTQMSGDCPVDNSDRPDTQMSCHTNGSQPIERTSGAPDLPIERTFSSIERTSGCPTTTHVYQPQLTNSSCPVPAELLNARGKLRVVS